MAKPSASASKTCLRSPTGWTPLEIQGFGALKVDIAYGGDSFVIVDAPMLGFAIRPDEARDLAEMGVRIIAAANEQLGFSHPQASGCDHISFCQFAGQLTREGNELQGSNACVIRPGKIDRSPTGTGCSARIAILSARGLMPEGDVYRARSIIGSEFVCRIARRTTIGPRPPLSRLFQAGPGLPASPSICWTWPIRGLRATGSRTLGRA
jgi:trans-L-3-hydroxyproline dehydratase